MRNALRRNAVHVAICTAASTSLPAIAAPILLAQGTLTGSRQGVDLSSLTTPLENGIATT